MKNYIIFLFALAMQGCQQSDEHAATELEGNWVGNCRSAFKVINSNTLINAAIKILITYTNSNVSININYYSDQDCTILDMILPLSETQLVSPETIPVTFETGNTITTSNGVTAKELNEYNANNELIPNIFLIQNDNTLYFGLKCYPTDASPGLTCVTSRPIELDYVNFYTKQN